MTIGNSAMADNLNADILEFIKATTAAMGLSLDVTLQDAPDGLHVDLDGEDGAVLLRRKGEALQALQHVANMAFRHRLGEQRRLIVDCQGFRRDKDVDSGRWRNSWQNGRNAPGSSRNWARSIPTSAASST